ncbi:MAG: kelch repeat-containing protein, partial [Isosphaeraceae bacterium]
SAELYNPATGVWSTTGSLNFGHYDATATLLPNGQVLVAGGDNGSGYLSSAELYNPATGQWSFGPRDNAMVTVLPNGLVLVAGGYNGSAYLSSAELYNPATGVWSATGSLNTPRYDATATLLPNGQVLVADGYNYSYLSSAELYNPATGVWSVTGSLNTPRDQATATLLPNGLVLVAGGYNGSYLSSPELYNPATGEWDNGFLSPRDLATATLLASGLVLVAGGYDGSGYLSSAVLYNPATGVWLPTGSLNTPRDLATATLLPSGLVLVAGGNNGYFAQSSAELYNPATGVWSYTGSLNTPRYDATATLLPNGLVLVAGGYNGSFWLSNAELYNPATGVWSLTGSLNVPRDLATATLLPNGQVLVTGGFNNSSGQLSSAELYNPATGVWSLTSSLNTARDHATATLLPNGQVLVVGGINGSSYLSNAELYASPILQAITVTSTNSSVLVGTTDQFTATGAYSDGSTQDLTSQVTWTSGTASVAIITPATGLAAGVAGGASAITASLNGLTSAPYVLTVKTLKSIAVTPQQPSVTPTAIATLVAMRPESQVNVPNNANGFFPAPAVSGLHSSGANIAVSWSGQLNINQAGTYTFFSTSDDGSLLYVDGSVVVNNDGVHGFQDGTSAAIFLSAGYHSFLELYIQGIYGAGVQVSYAGPDTPSGSEEVVPASAFPQQLTASYYNLSSQPSNVEAAFNLSPATVAVGGTRQLTATATYSDGSIQNITAQVAWASATTSDAIITPATGLAAGVAPGTSLITASLNGLTSPPLVLTVAAPTLQSIAVSAANPSVVAGFRDRFTAMGTYSDGSTTNLTSQVTWYSAMTSVASISTARVATGLAQGS